MRPKRSIASAAAASHCALSVTSQRAPRCPRPAGLRAASAAACGVDIGRAARARRARRTACAVARPRPRGLAAPVTMAACPSSRPVMPGLPYDCGHAFGVEPVVAVQVRRRAEQGILVGHADAHELRVPGPLRRSPRPPPSRSPTLTLCSSAVMTTPCALAAAADRVLVDRRDRVHVDDAELDAIGAAAARPRRGSALTRLPIASTVACAPFAQRVAAADAPVGRRVVDRLLAAAAGTEVDRPRGGRWCRVNAARMALPSHGAISVSPAMARSAPMSFVAVVTGAVEAHRNARVRADHAQLQPRVADVVADVLEPISARKNE